MFTQINTITEWSTIEFRQQNRINIWNDIEKENEIYLTSGVNLWNSAIQLGRVDKGPQTRKGPGTPLWIISAIVAMHWTVFPNPISSAKMPLIPFSQSI